MRLGKLRIPDILGHYIQLLYRDLKVSRACAGNRDRVKLALSMFGIKDIRTNSMLQILWRYQALWSVNLLGAVGHDFLRTTKQSG